MISFKDQLNRELFFNRTPKRIVSLVPSQTELLVDLGLENRLVGITKFCVHPKHLKNSKTIVGGTKNIKIEKVKSLNPDIILCNKEENTEEIVRECTKICPVHISDIYTINDNLELINMYGNLFDCSTKSNQLIDSINSQLTKFQLFIKDRPKLKVAYFIWKKPWMVAGNNTFINHLLELNNFENKFQYKERYPEIDLIDLQDLDYIFLSSEPYPFKEKDIEELKEKTNCKNIILVDGEYFSWYGSRILKAFNYYKKVRRSLIF